MKYSLVSALVVTLSLSFSLSVSAQTRNPDDATGTAHGSTGYPGNVSGSPNPLIQEMVQKVSIEALVTTLNNLQNFGTRYEYSAQRESSATWLLNQYRQLGLEAHAEPYQFVAEHLSDIDIVSDSCAYIVGVPDLLARTTDGGATWSQLSTGTSISPFDAVDFIDEERGWVVGGLGTCFRTTDAGKSWAQSTITPIVFHDVAFFDSLTGLAVGEGGALYRTTNGGSAWSPCTAPVGKTALRELKVVGTRSCWAVGDSGVIVSSQDAGFSWVRQSTPVNAPMYGIDFIDGLHGWAVGGKGFYAIGPGEGFLLKTADGGQTWRQLAKPPEAGCLGSVYAVDSLQIWITDPRGRLFLSTDGGESWQMKLDLMVGDLRSYAIRIRGNRSSRVGLVGRDGLLCISGDGGASWENRTYRLPAEMIHTSANIVAALPGEVTPEKEFLLLSHYDSKSNTPMTLAPGANDNGTGTSLVLEAARVCHGYRFASTLRFLAVSAEELGLIGSAAYTRAMIQRGTNLIGAVNTDMVGYPVTGDSLRLVVESFYTPNPLRDSVLLYRSRYEINAHLTAVVDSTAASDHVSLTEAGYPAVCLSEGSSREVIGHDPFLHTTSDNVSNVWPGMVRRATQIAVATAAEFAGPLGVSEARHTQPLPAEISLQQNFPNPFNPTTTIRYALPHRAHVALTVYNTLGQKVAELVHGDVDAGNHELPFNASSLASGVYFYRLQSGTFTRVRSMVLVR